VPGADFSERKPPIYVAPNATTLLIDEVPIAFSKLECDPSPTEMRHVSCYLRIYSASVDFGRFTRTVAIVFPVGAQIYFGFFRKVACVVQQGCDLSCEFKSDNGVAAIL
jgi:hypothetical protein